MDNSKIRNALQDLINRLQDAEKGFTELKNATSSPVLTKWMGEFANERHHMHRELEKLHALTGAVAEVDTTFLGELHRMFIDLKINNTNYDNQLDAVVDEVERGATTLISDFQKVLKEVPMPIEFVSVLNSQKSKIENELSSLIRLKDELTLVESEA